MRVSPCLKSDVFPRLLVSVLVFLLAYVYGWMGGPKQKLGRRNEKIGSPLALLFLGGFA